MESKGAPVTYEFDVDRPTQPIIDTWQRLQRLGLSPQQIHEALQPMVALVEHYKRRGETQTLAANQVRPPTVVRRVRAS